MNAPTMRCTYFDGGPSPIRCEADATHRLIDPHGKLSQWGTYCLEHAHGFVDVYHEKMGGWWTMEPLDPQAARIAELEAELGALKE